ncbi:TonB-dependent receptor domain-containing protein [Aliikangiella maris]|uniref:TonB-dependent receptor n=2 Tax=Aliikangiella maris TaxID=3162458 RepID=A0ABV3MKQ8_9GAMM
MTGESDGETTDFAITWGNNFADDKGNVTVHLSYSEEKEIPMTARSYAVRDPSFLPNPVNTGPDDGIADANGNPVCRSGNIACVPYNPINNLASPEALSYASVVLIRTDEIKQTVASFSFNGDLFEMPAGMVAFAAGLEYRDEKSKSTPDPLTQAIDPDGVGSGLVGSTTGASRSENSFVLPTRGDYKVKEVFFESIFPLLIDQGIESLDFEVAARYSDYNTTGGDSTYKSALNLTINEMIRTRVTYSLAVRAPNVQELFSPQQIQGRFVTVPCDANNLNSGPNPANRQSNCAALGIADDFQSEAAFGSRNVITQGNLELIPEEATTLTAGFVFTPFDALSVAVDYWDIEIEDAITSFDSTDILNNCVDSSSLNAEFCGLIARDNSGQINSIAVKSINAAKFNANGVDLDVFYRHGLDNSTLNFSFQGTYLDERKFQQNSENPEDINSQAGQVATPHFRALINSVYSIDNISTAWTINYIGESTFNKVAQPEQYPDWFNNKVKAYTYHSLNFSYEYNDDYRFYLGIDNVLDKEPPNLPGLNAGGLLYDGIGRKYYAGVRISL